MMLMYPGAKAETGHPPDAKIVAAMMKYNEELAKAGVLLALDGLHASAKGARITVRGGKRDVVDGPFTEAKELVGGYWMIQVKSRDEAIAWASRIPLGEDEMVELRQVYELTDFPPDVQQLAEPLARR
ncbi:MAG TPA: YciI family protein [Kofleriaceae bacterium]|nr:YciI family protein [Kofleriaceae bacterium]